MGLAMMQDDVDRARMARFIMALRARGIRDQRILNAFERVPRETYLQGALEAYAYEDWLLPIPCGQTIESPLLPRLCAGASRRHDGEEGAGGRHRHGLRHGAPRAAVPDGSTASSACGSCTRARRGVSAASGSRISSSSMGTPFPTRVGAGFDRILVHGAAGSPPRVLLDQLAPGGRILVTVGGLLTEIERRHGEMPQRTVCTHAAQPLGFGRATLC